MPLDKLTYNGNIVDLRHSLNIKGALPVVHGSIQKFGNKSYLKHLINSASNFGQTILLEYLNPYDIRYPSKDFNNHPPKFAPVLIGGLGAHYAYDCIKHLSAPTPMRYEDPTISFLQMSLYNLRGKTQYEAFSKLASLDDVLAAFVFMGWARKNAPDLVNQYMELFTQSQRMLTSACAAGGVAITIELQSPNIIRVSMFSPAERLSWGVEKV